MSGYVATEITFGGVHRLGFFNTGHAQARPHVPSHLSPTVRTPGGPFNPRSRGEVGLRFDLVRSSRMRGAAERALLDTGFRFCYNTLARTGTTPAALTIGTSTW